MTDVLRVSNSKVKTFQRCQKKYKFRYIKKLRKKDKSLPLERGSWIHELLMAMYDGEDWKAIHEENTAAFYEAPEEEREELGDLPREIARIMRSYRHHWKEQDSLYRTIDSELDEIMTMPDGYEFNFIIDQIVEDESGGLWLRDHKTVTKWMPADFMLLDAQLTRYFWCAERMGYTPLMGIEFNEIITKAPTVPELILAPGQKKKSKSNPNPKQVLTQRKNLRSDYWTYLATLKKHGFDPKDYAGTLHRLRENSDEWFRRSAMPKDKPVTDQMMADLDDIVEQIKAAEERGVYPRTPEKACTWDCEYSDICTLSLQGGSVKDLVKMRYVRNRRDD